MASRISWKREFENLADRVASCILAWERATDRGEKVNDVLSTVIRADALDPAADLCKRPRMKRRVPKPKRDYPLVLTPKQAAARSVTDGDIFAGQVVIVANAGGPRG